MSPVRRVLICDDSAAYAKSLAKFLEHDDQLEVAAICASGEEALRQVPAIAPDIVTMDLEMPGMGGVRAIEEIMRVRPTPILVISSHAGKSSERVAEALAAGALEVLPKDGLRLDRADDVWARAVSGRVKRLASVHLRARRPSGVTAAEARSAAALDRASRVIGIGASTGGPPALRAVLAEIPAAFQLPIVVVQHMAAGFIEGLVGWLDGQVPLPVRLASDGARAEPGVWFAPDGAHLLVEPSMRFSLDDTTAGTHRPSVDMLFQSIAAGVCEAGVGVVLTGMGRDGESGVEAILAAGGLVIAQDEASSAVYGMPQVAADAGALSLPLEAIAAGLRRSRIAQTLP
jgi:two-component system chemotaxis response regulator CheB